MIIWEQRPRCWPRAADYPCVTRSQTSLLIFWKRPFLGYETDGAHALTVVSFCNLSHAYTYTHHT